MISNGRKGGETKSAQEVARMVWSFMEAAGALVEDMDADDEVKLLRLRTKRNELVIVPGKMDCLRDRSSIAASLTPRDADPKFILVVIHDTPPA